VAGADGQTMPMMVSSAGANRRYELPLDGLESGSFTIRWRAIDEAGSQHQGTIAFRAG
jgi:methionine-rich copper-binding protein CopC